MAFLSINNGQAVSVSPWTSCLTLRGPRYYGGCCSRESIVVTTAKRMGTQIGAGHLAEEADTHHHQLEAAAGRLNTEKG